MGTVFAVVVYSHSAISIIMNTSTRPSLRLQLLVLVVTVAATATTSNAAPQALLPRPGGEYPVEVDGQTSRFVSDDLHRRSLSLGRPICTSIDDCAEMLYNSKISKSHSRSKRSPVIPGPFFKPASLKTTAAAIALLPAGCTTFAGCPVFGTTFLAKMLLSYIVG